MPDKMRSNALHYGPPFIWVTPTAYNATQIGVTHSVNSLSSQIQHHPHYQLTKRALLRHHVVQLSHLQGEPLKGPLIPTLTPRD